MFQLEGQLYQQQIYQLTNTEDSEEIALQVVAADNLPPVGHTQTVVCSAPTSRSPSPEPVVQEQRLPSVLEAAIKAEPKVEVKHKIFLQMNSHCNNSYVQTWHNFEKKFQTLLWILCTLCSLLLH